MSELRKAISDANITGATHKKPRLDKKLSDALNMQVTNELYSSMLYSYISSYLDDNGYVNAASLFLKYSKEEMEHMYKIIEYLYDRNCKVVICQPPTVSADCASFKDAFVQALQHEIKVTKQWDEIYQIARDLYDSATAELTHWFANEQIEEEDKHRKILYLFDMGIPSWELEEMLKP